MCFLLPAHSMCVCVQVRKADPSRLVFIDNAGRPQQSNDNLNFRLVEGVDEWVQSTILKQDVANWSYFPLHCGTQAW